MNLRCQTLAVAAAAALALPALASATPTSYADDAYAAAVVASTARSGQGASTTTAPAVDASGSDFLARAVDATSPAGSDDRNEALAASSGHEAIALSAPALRNPLSSSLRSSSDLFLWNFVALLHAQQIDRGFDQVDAGIAALPPAAVIVTPLPDSVWLFGSGMLALAGLWPRRRRGVARPSPRGRAPELAVA